MEVGTQSVPVELENHTLPILENAPECLLYSHAFLGVYGLTTSVKLSKTEQSLNKTAG